PPGQETPRLLGPWPGPVDFLAGKRRHRCPSKAAELLPQRIVTAPEIPWKGNAGRRGDPPPCARALRAGGDPPAAPRSGESSPGLRGIPPERPPPSRCRALAPRLHLRLVFVTRNPGRR